MKKGTAPSVTDERIQSSIPQELIEFSEFTLKQCVEVRTSAHQNIPE
jgi:hypothetical protein